MADKTDDIRQEIEKGRQELSNTHAAITEKLARLEDRIQKTVLELKNSFDLHYQVNQHPWLLLGGSLLVGYLLGPRRGGSSARMKEPSSRKQPQLVGEGPRSQFEGAIDTIKGAAFGAVISTLWAMAKQVLLPPAQNNESIIAKSPVQLMARPQHNTMRGLNAQTTNGRSDT